jgi:hypothetical protein
MKGLAKGLAKAVTNEIENLGFSLPIATTNWSNWCLVRHLFSLATMDKLSFSWSIHKVNLSSSLSIHKLLFSSPSVCKLLRLSFRLSICKLLLFSSWSICKLFHRSI